MLKGLELLMKFKEASSQNSEYFIFQNVKIRKTSFDRGMLLYETGIYKFLGECIVNLLKDKKFASINELREILKPQSDAGVGKWLDLAGLCAPEQEVHNLLIDIENGSIDTIEKVELIIKLIYDNYPEYEWAFAADVLKTLSGKKIDEILPSDIIELITKCADFSINLDNQLIRDAGREFGPNALFGYGIDGGLDEKQADFEFVRGTLENDKFISDIENHIKTISEVSDDLISRLKQIK